MADLLATVTEGVQSLKHDFFRRRAISDFSWFTTAPLARIAVWNQRNEHC